MVGALGGTQYGSARKALGVPAKSASGVGLIMPFSANPGAGWLLCNGANYSASQYPALSAILPVGLGGGTYNQIGSGVVQSIAYGNGKFFASVGTYNSTSYFLTSQDGLNWNSVSGVTTGTAGFNNTVLYGNGIWTYIDGSTYWVSLDNGVTWTNYTSSLPVAISSGVGATKTYFVNGYFFYYYNSSNLLAYSTDGHTWTTKSGAVYAQYGLVYANSNYYSGGPAGNPGISIFSTPSGAVTNYSSRFVGSNDNILGIVSNGSKVVVIDQVTVTGGSNSSLFFTQYTPGTAGATQAGYMLYQGANPSYGGYYGTTGGLMYVLGSSHENTNWWYITTSADGLIWTPTNYNSLGGSGNVFGATTPPECMCIGGGVILIGDSSGYIVRCTGFNVPNIPANGNQQFYIKAA